MCMRNTSEGCILSEQQSALKKDVLSLDERIPNYITNIILKNVI